MGAAHALDPSSAVLALAHQVRILLPYRLEQLQRIVDSYARWYNEHRPHQAPGGATPNEVLFGLPKKIEAPRLEPRARDPATSKCAAPNVPVDGEPGCQLKLELSHLGGAKHLPVVELIRKAA